MVTWTNLGLLYLHHQDLELANEAFLRAQVLDSNYPLVWLGQGLVASAHGHEHDAEQIFEHIVGLETTIVGLVYIQNIYEGPYSFPGRSRPFVRFQALLPDSRGLSGAWGC